MEAALWVAKTGLDAQQTRMTVIANNLANVNTTGFKRDRATFEDLLYQNVKQGGAQTSADTIRSLLPPGTLIFQAPISKQRPTTDPSPIGGQMILISHRWSHHAFYWYIKTPRNVDSSLVSPCPTNTPKSAY